MRQCWIIWINLIIERVQKIINMIKKGASIASIVMETGEREVEILRLKREYKAEWIAVG